MTPLRPLALACLLLSPPAWAGTLYKCTGADGVPAYVSKRVSGSRCEVDRGLEQPLRRLLLGHDETTCQRVPREAFDAHVADRRAQLDRQRACCTMDRACGVWDQVQSPVTLFTQDELAMAHVGNALRVVEVSALWP